MKFPPASRLRCGMNWLMHLGFRSAARLGMLLMAALLCGGCASQGPVEARLEPKDYLPAFETARKVLRDADFQLDRVDAYSGVITTLPKGTGGLGTPWDREQSTPGQEVEDLLNRQSRVVRVTFEPQDAGARTGVADGTRDLREVEAPVVMRVEVTLFRRQRPGWRLETSAIRSSTHSRDPDLAAREMEPTYSSAFDEDRLFAGRVVESVMNRLGTRD